MFVLAACALGHNGVVHKPGESSSIGVAPAFIDDCTADCYTIYNYGQNYVRLSENGQTTDIQWPIEYLPVAAAAISRKAVLAAVDDNTRVKLIIREGNNELELGPESGCPDPEHLVKFVDSLDTRPNVLDLKKGSVFEIDTTAQTCITRHDFPTGIDSDPLMFDGATFYGFAQNPTAGIRCWFYGVKSSQASIACFDTDNNHVFTSPELNDGRVNPANYHTGGDIFFNGDCLHVVNGDTNPGSLRDRKVQFETHFCGKAVAWCGVGTVPSPVAQFVGVGLRHPWTSVPLSDQRRLIGDVGQDSCEEVSLLDLTSTGTIVYNFGWPKFECNILRGAVVPYNLDTEDAPIVYSDRTRTKALQTYDFVIYIVLGIAVTVAAVFIFISGTLHSYQAAAFVVLVLVGLPFMSAAPDYIGYDNGVWSTETRTLIPYQQTMFPEYSVMTIFFFVALTVLPLGMALNQRWVIAAGAMSALVYLITFASLVESPATVLPLAILAFCGIAVLFFLLWLSNNAPKYSIIESM